MSLKNRVAVVTGAGRGIGKEIALALAREGASLAINSLHKETIKPVAEEIERMGGSVLPLVLDVSKEEDVNTYVKEVFDRFEKVDILVNNAGKTKDNFFLRMDSSDWDEVINLNLRGTFLCTRLFSRKMVKNKYGRIINITSVAGEAGNVGQANYSAAKAGVMGLTKSAAKELARYGITVNAVSPGMIDTDMLAGMEAAVREEIIKSIPTGRLGRAEDVAAAVVFLASESASYITGQSLRVDGGLYI